MVGGGDLVTYFRFASPEFKRLTPNLSIGTTFKTDIKSCDKYVHADLFHEYSAPFTHFAIEIPLPLSIFP